MRREPARQQLLGLTPVDGNRAVVGAFNEGDSGSAFVFTRQEGSGTWEQTVELTPGRSNDRFGTGVSVSGSVVVGGAPNGGGPEGVAYACYLQVLSRESCRAAIPIVDELITMSDPITSCCVGSDFSITATFTNASNTSIPAPFFDVVQLTGGNLLQNADEGPGGEGATLTPDVVDDVLSPGESMTAIFSPRHREDRFPVCCQVAPFRVRFGRTFVVSGLPGLHVPGTPRTLMKNVNGSRVCKPMRNSRVHRDLSARVAELVVEGDDRFRARTLSHKERDGDIEVVHVHCASDRTGIEAPEKFE